MGGFFKVFSVTDLENSKIGDKFKESDYSSITPNGKFIQMDFIEENTLDKYEVKPGIWKMAKTAIGLRLAHSSFTKDEILESFVNTKELETKIDCFFRNLDVYKKLKRQTPKRACLLWGPPGTGKSASLIYIANKYVEDNKTAVIIWSTDALDPFDVKNFIQTFQYNGVERLILIAEDLGGVEIERVKLKSMASLLSLLDNKEQTFTIPVFIIATTNFPEAFLSNITNRPQRIDDKIEVPNPTAEQRKELFLFFLRNFQDKYKPEEIKDVSEAITQHKYAGFSIAHIEDVIIRSQIYEQPLFTSLTKIQAEIVMYNKEFQTNKTKLGIAETEDYDE